MSLPSFPLTSKPSLIFLLLCLLPPRIDAFYFSFPSFASNRTYIKIEGDAHFKEASLFLSRTEEFSVGRALYRDPIQLWEVKGSEKVIANFNTNFSFQISKDQGPSGDGHGLAFALVGENGDLPKKSFGGLLGLFSSEEAALPGSTKNQVVAVEFDTFQNNWDPSTYHIGIDVNSIKSKDHTNVPDGFIKNGIANVNVVYNAKTKILSASLRFRGKSTKSYVVSYPVDLSVALPQRVRVGFTASTRTFVEIHQLYSWSFSSSIDNPPPSPPPPVKNTPPPPTIPSPVGENTPPTPTVPPPEENNTPPTPTIPSPPGNNTPPPSLPLGKKMMVLVVSVTGGLFVVVLISGAAFCWCRRNKNSYIKIVKPVPIIDGDLGPKRFSYLELDEATNGFAEELILGKGGFGDVFEGTLVGDSNEKVAVKKFRSGSNQGETEYVSEINVISRLKHKNLVQLKGWCHENDELLLVYEFMPNRSLDIHLFGRNLPLLSWSRRYNIALGLASALQYLQDGSDPGVVHRDIKSSNIMLDSNFNAKLGDFGLAKLTNHEQSLTPTVLAGTLGYLAPEVILKRKASKATDIYSYGVVALELASGRKPINHSERDPSKPEFLSEWVWDLYTQGLILEAIDKRLNGEYDEDQAKRLLMVGLWCCHPNPAHRPSIKQVIDALCNFENEPKVPLEMPEIPYTSPLMNMVLPLSNASANSEYGSTTRVAQSTTTTTTATTTTTTSSSI